MKVTTRIAKNGAVNLYVDDKRAALERTAKEMTSNPAEFEIIGSQHAEPNRILGKIGTFNFNGITAKRDRYGSLTGVTVYEFANENGDTVTMERAEKLPEFVIYREVIKTVCGIPYGIAKFTAADTDAKVEDYAVTLDAQDAAIESEIEQAAGTVANVDSKPVTETKYEDNSAGIETKTAKNGVKIYRFNGKRIAEADIFSTVTRVHRELICNEFAAQGISAATQTKEPALNDDEFFARIELHDAFACGWNEFRFAGEQEATDAAEKIKAAFGKKFRKAEIYHKKGFYGMPTTLNKIVADTKIDTATEIDAGEISEAEVEDYAVTLDAQDSAVDAEIQNAGTTNEKPDTVDETEIDASDYAISEDAFNFSVAVEIEEAEQAAFEARVIARTLADDNLAARYEKAKSQVKCERYENGWYGWYFKGKNRTEWEYNETKAAACLSRYGLLRSQFATFHDAEVAVIEGSGIDETAFDLLPSVDELNDEDDADDELIDEPETPEISTDEYAVTVEAQDAAVEADDETPQWFIDVQSPAMLINIGDEARREYEFELLAAYGEQATSVISIDEFKFKRYGSFKNTAAVIDATLQAETFKPAPVAESEFAEYAPATPDKVKNHGNMKADDFAEKMAELTADLKEANAACTEAIKLREIKRKEFDNACEAAEDAEILLCRKHEAIANFGYACAIELDEKLIDRTLIFSPTMKVTNQEGGICETNFEQIGIFFHEDHCTFYLSADWIFLGEYDTPVQVEAVINSLKAAIKRGDTEFTFPTIEELSEPVHVSKIIAENPVIQKKLAQRSLTA